jgi:hypothetical protein
MKHKRRNELRYPGLWRGCVGAWNPGLGPTGLVLRDNSGFGNHGTLTNGPTFAASQGKYAMSFDGVDDNIITDRWSGVDLAKPFSFVGRFRMRSISNYDSALLSQGNPATGGIVVTNVYNKLMVIVNNIHWSGGATVLVPGKDYSIAIVRDTTGHPSTGHPLIYLNGAYDNQTLGGGAGYSSTNNSSQLNIGYNATHSTYHKGMISEIMAYNRRLSDAEIKLLASRCGIAYEMAPRRRSSALVSLNLNNLMMGSSF